MPNRSTIFISHGNPEDNEIAGWLAARLAGAGYKVWIDLWHDKGHPTWEEIEEEIRIHSIRVVALVSKIGVTKPGFKDEVNAACGVGRELEDRGFVIPIRLDDISFRSEVPIQLGRLNFIDGNSLGWDGLLAELLNQLDRDSVEREPVASTALYQTWLTRRNSAETLVSSRPERILSNWFKVEAFPKHINFYSSDSLRSNWELAATTALKFPKKFENGLLCTFTPVHDVRMSLPLGVKLKRVKWLKTETFLSGETSSPLFTTRLDATRAMVDLVRQGFAQLALKRGFQEHKLSNRLCWFPPYSLLRDERIKFMNDGFSGSRKLVGRHKEFFWHYGISVDMAWTPPIRMTALGHVLFSVDGENILQDVKIAANLRRKANRSKRNAWWRDVMLGYFAFLASWERSIRIPMGGDAAITISASPIDFICPRRLEFDAGPAESEDDPIDPSMPDEDEVFEADELDEPDEED
jgi:hypothetical protein